VITGCEGEALDVVEDRAALMSSQLWRIGVELSVESRSLGWDGHVLDVAGPGFEHCDLHLPLVGDFQPSNAALAVAAAHALGVGGDKAVRDGLAATRWPGRLQVVGEHPRVILDGGHNPAAMVKAGAALRRLIDGDRLVAVFAMLTERDPIAILAALRTTSPDAVVFTEPSSALGHAVAPETLADVWGPGALVARPVTTAVEQARQLAGPAGSVLVCGSLYLVGEILAVTARS